jgi:repressor of nif and glnA expression
MVEEGNNLLSPQEVARLATSRGFGEFEIKAVRHRLRRLVDMGFLEPVRQTYRVTPAAIQRFGLKAAKPPPEDASDGSA